jgi:hypothetical protein
MIAVKKRSVLTMLIMLAVIIIVSGCGRHGIDDLSDSEVHAIVEGVDSLDKSEIARGLEFSEYLPGGYFHLKDEAKYDSLFLGLPKGMIVLTGIPAVDDQGRPSGFWAAGVGLVIEHRLRFVVLFNEASDGSLFKVKRRRDRLFEVEGYSGRRSNKTGLEYIDLSKIGPHSDIAH